MVAQRAACAAAWRATTAGARRGCVFRGVRGRQLERAPEGRGSRRADAAAMISAKVRRSDHGARGMVSALGRVGTNVRARLQATSRKTPLGATSELVDYSRRAKLISLATSGSRHKRLRRVATRARRDDAEPRRTRRTRRRWRWRGLRWRPRLSRRSSDRRPASRHRGHPHHRSTAGALQVQRRGGDRVPARHEQPRPRGGARVL